MQNIKHFQSSRSQFVKNINPLAAIGTTNNTAIATVGSFNLENKADKKALINRMRKTLVPFNGKIIKSNKL